MRYAFYLSGRGGRFHKILGSNHKILEDTGLVFSDSPGTDYMEEELRQRGIPYERRSFTSLPVEGKGRNACLSDLLLEKLTKYKIDYCFSFGAHLLRGVLLEQYRDRIINFHPSLLPKYPGNHAIDQALRMGEEILGNTAHFIDAGVDTGPVILQRAVPRKVFERAGYDGVMDVQIEMLGQIAAMIESGKLHDC